MLKRKEKQLPTKEQHKRFVETASNSALTGRVFEKAFKK